MLIHISGKPSKISENLVREAAVFYSEILLKETLRKKIELTIEFEEFDKRNSDYAYCDWMDDNHRAREFLITIDENLSKKETLYALAHEMVHLKQYAKGELKDIFRPVRMVKWMGQNIVAEEIDYWEQPWEWEAYCKERFLYYKFSAHLRKKRKCQDTTLTKNT